jgi:hypothetical protein
MRFCPAMRRGEAATPARSQAQKLKVNLSSRMVTAETRMATNKVTVKSPKT